MNPSPASDERQIIIRNMHDGLVSTLMSTMVALERGTTPVAEVLEALRDCVERSRLVVDSLEPIGHDVVVLLATMRHRLGPRLEAAGLNVRWEVQDVPELPWLGASQALQVMRIVQETLTNVVRHARAGSLRIATRRVDDVAGSQGVIIEIEDDGIGFAPDACGGGNGINHLRSRAQQLGATVAIVSSQGKGTKITLTLPSVFAPTS